MPRLQHWLLAHTVPISAPQLESHYIAEPWKFIQSPPPALWTYQELLTTETYFTDISISFPRPSDRVVPTSHPRYPTGVLK